MAAPLTQRIGTMPWRRLSDEAAGNPGLQAFWILRVAYTALPLIMGMDKFVGALTNWDRYLAPPLARALGDRAHAFMLAVGAVEIVAGIGVALVPRVFGYVVAAWLCGIIANLLMTPAFNDVGLRDLGLALGAIALARLAAAYERR